MDTVLKGKALKLSFTLPRLIESVALEKNTGISDLLINHLCSTWSVITQIQIYTGFSNKMQGFHTGVIGNPLDMNKPRKCQIKAKEKSNCWP